MHTLCVQHDYMSVPVSVCLLQDDVLLPQMSVWETLAFFAAMRVNDTNGHNLGGHNGRHAVGAGAKPIDTLRRERVEEVLSALGLARQRDTLVGA